MAKGLERRQGSPFWYYRFKIGGRRFRGSTETTSEREARRILAEQMDKAAEEMKRADKRRGFPNMRAICRLPPVKIVGEFRTLMCKRNRAAASLPDERDATTKLQTKIATGRRR
jgi:hypothetical protein